MGSFRQLWQQLQATGSFFQLWQQLQAIYSGMTLARRISLPLYYKQPPIVAEAPPPPHMLDGLAAMIVPKVGRVSANLWPFTSGST